MQNLMRAQYLMVMFFAIYRTKFPELMVDSESNSGQREKIMGIIAGMISAGMSFG